jgi:hypothetical protein
MTVAIPITKLDPRTRARLLQRGRLHGQCIQVSLRDYQREVAADVRRRTHRGPGDLLAAILHPFVIALDHLFGTRLEQCHTCAQRRDRLNRWWHRSLFRIRGRGHPVKKTRIL